MWRTVDPTTTVPLPFYPTPTNPDLTPLPFYPDPSHEPIPLPYLTGGPENTFVIPTKADFDKLRGEVESLQKEVYALRREVRILRKKK